MSYRYTSKPPLTFGTFLLLLLFALPAVGVHISEIVQNIKFNAIVTGYLKRAADANTIQIAEQELDKALSEIEKRGLTKGNTYVLWETPATDIGFWYNNLKTSSQELKNLSPETSAMEKSNMLIKLRETLLDHGQQGDHVTVPYGIGLYPYNSGYFFGSLVAWAFFGIVIIIAGCVYNLD